MKNKAFLWINAVLFYDLSNLKLWNSNSNRERILEWMNNRKPLSVRIKEYNKKS
jgi:type I restriction-modification system DNA methylase subunit